MEMIRVIAGVALIGAIFFVLWNKDHTLDHMLPTHTPEHPTVSHISLRYITNGCQDLRIERSAFVELKQQLAKRIVGQDGLIHALLIALLTNSHALIEGVPGLAKTKTIASLAQALQLSFQRIQFTADMLPGDITGVEIFNSHTKSFELQRGPIFAHIVLADEINRATPKVQSALLEAMQEQQVTIGNDTLPLPHPFFVLATQNPIEQEGTYLLPEAQVDRFLMKIVVTYPSHEQEERMLSLLEQPISTIEPVVDQTGLLHAQEEVNKIFINDALKTYIVRLVQATRDSPMLQYGASPRASLACMQASKACAWLSGKDEVMIEHIHRVLLLVLRHRVIPAYKAQISKKNIDDLLVDIIQNVPVELG